MSATRITRPAKQPEARKAATAGVLPLEGGVGKPRVSLMEAEAMLDKALRSKDGLNRVAASMNNPVKRLMDYKAIFRKLVVVETDYPAGFPFIYDRDLEPIPAIKVGSSATSRFVDAVPERGQIGEFELVMRVKVPYKELYVRRYKVLNRAKERLAEGLGIKEDLIGFDLLATAANFGGVYGTTPIGPLGTALSKDALARAFAQIERKRLLAEGILISPIGLSGIRRFSWTDIDQEGLKELRQSGYLGSLWGAKFFMSDLVLDDKAYAFAAPEYLGWMPFRKELDIQPADDPDNLRLGFVAYELLGMVITNVSGVVEISYDDTK